MQARLDTLGDDVLFVFGAIGNEGQAVDVKDHFSGRSPGGHRPHGCGGALVGRGPFMDKDAAEDPWGQPFSYRSPGKTHPGAYDLISAGRDGMPDTRDDIEAP